jgi:serine/threonine-protein kinase
MATVHRARDRITGNTVALKLLHPEYIAQRGFIQRFRQEARLSSRVISPHALRVYEYYRDGPHHVLLMDFVEGETLAALLTKSDRLSESRTLVIAQDIAKALEAAGRVSVIHRDIKPSNVMLSPRGAVLMDFGIARAVSSSSISAEGDFVGTPHYCSPEQAAGREVDARSDLYSLGVLLFECLVGRPPFESDDPLEILWRKQEEAAEDIRILRPMISTATATLVALLLQTKPDDRPCSAIELSRLIVGAQRGDAPIASRRKPDPVAEGNTDSLGVVSAGSGRVALYWIVGIALLITFIALYEACYLSGA